MQLDDVLPDAQAGKPQAVRGLLVALYAQSFRLSLALSGHEDVAAAVAQRMTRQALLAMPDWSGEEEASRWLFHHTLLTTRLVARKPVEPADEPLIRVTTDGTNASQAVFVRALRKLPRQQTEAILLRHGERLDIRRSATAMDCSITATQMHLEQASTALSRLVGGDLQPHLDRLYQAYENLTPPEQIVLPQVQRHVRRARIKRWLRRIAIAVILLGLAAGAYLLYDAVWLAE